MSKIEKTFEDLSIQYDKKHKDLVRHQIMNLPGYDSSTQTSHGHKKILRFSFAFGGASLLVIAMLITFVIPALSQGGFKSNSALSTNIESHDDAISLLTEEKEMSKEESPLLKKNDKATSDTLRDEEISTDKRSIEDNKFALLLTYEDRNLGEKIADDFYSTKERGKKSIKSEDEYSGSTTSKTDKASYKNYAIAEESDTDIKQKKESEEKNLDDFISTQTFNEIEIAVASPPITESPDITNPYSVIDFILRNSITSPKEDNSLTIEGIKDFDENGIILVYFHSTEDVTNPKIKIKLGSGVEYFSPVLAGLDSNRTEGKTTISHQKDSTRIFKKDDSFVFLIRTVSNDQDTDLGKVALSYKLQGQAEEQVLSKEIIINEDGIAESSKLIKNILLGYLIYLNATKPNMHETLSLFYAEHFFYTTDDHFTEDGQIFIKTVIDNNKNDLR